MLRSILAPLLLSAMTAFAEIPESQLGRTEFTVKQVTAGGVYIDGGSAHGLAEGMRMSLERRTPGEARMAAKRIGDIVIVAVATQSAFAEVQNPVVGVEPATGDVARLSSQDLESMQRITAARHKKRYAQVISFTSGDPLEEEVREYVPMPPPSEVGRFRGRLGFEYNTLNNRDGGGSSHQEGAIVRTDWTRINGTYWNLTGYWRGRWNTRSGSGGQQTLTDLVNRTYTMGLYYSNPRSKNQYALGRILLPWASSLSTIDGGYAARRLHRAVTAGIFAGSTPDPTMWNYDPHRQMLGVFTSFEAGRFEKVRWTGTVGAATTRVKWRPERNFMFVENSLFVNTKLSILDSMEVDLKNPRLMNGATGTMLSRSFLTVRVQPSNRISFDVNQNYFRGLPTFDTALIGTGLLDKYLFQGFSGGFRAFPLQRLLIGANLGRSHSNSDSRSSLNQMYNVAWTRLPYISARLDGRYTRFNSSFGAGTYQTVSLTRELGEGLRLEFMVGQQDFKGAMTRQSRSRFINGQADWNLGLHYFLTAGWLSYRGQIQNYDQMFVTAGYRF